MSKSQSVKTGRKKASKPHGQPSQRTYHSQSPARMAETQPASFDQLLGRGATLWSDDEFERFRVWLRETRRNGD
jgi:hypothetical protein